MPTCRKCGTDFANSVIVNGKVRNLQRRKYCLDCSGFGERNTKKLELSNEGKRSISFDAQYIRKRRVELKLKAVELKGGKCSICGYDKCLQALEFHHLDPSTKLIQLSVQSFGSKNWQSIVEELEKCILVCSNCHREIEYAVSA